MRSSFGQSVGPHTRVEILSNRISQLNLHGIASGIWNYAICKTILRQVREQNASDVWTLSDLFRNDWAQLSHLKVVFEVSVGDGYLGDIAIDDIVLDTQPCGPRRECDFEVGQRLCHKLCTNLVFFADGLFNNNIEFPNSRQGSEWRITITWNVRTRYKMRYLDQHQSIKE